MKRILLALALILAPSAAFAQARVIGATCGDLSAVGGNYTAGGMANLTQTTNGSLCTNASGGGGSGGVVTQGAQDATAAAWAMKMAVGAASDGWNITVGTRADTVWDGVASSASEMAYLRYIAINSAKPIAVTAKRLTLTTAQQLGTGARSLGFVQCYNPSAAVAYVQVLDANPPTLGSTVPISSIGIAPSQTGGIALGTMAMNTTTALYVASTTGPANATTVSMECNFGYF